ncbi:MAG TPA: hypothetical protein VFS39_05495 [Nitrospira sp.]|nr:hypothetical protein [Nitrospira sp.]
MSRWKTLVKQYGEYSIKLAELLKEDETVDLEEQIFIENHLLIVQLALTTSKYRRRKKLRESGSHAS